jgi:putative effector of murein hydrolase
MLVVSNGVLGQLLYPFILDKLGVSRYEHDEMTTVSTTHETMMTAESLPTQSPPNNHLASLSVNANDTVPFFPLSWHQTTSTADSPITVAAGIAIGINGAAMGVSYLYESRSRAAPYAALSMMVFGVMTVVFTTVEPFKSILIGLANRS